LKEAKKSYIRECLFPPFRKAFLYILRGSDYREKGGRTYFPLLQAGDIKKARLQRAVGPEKAS
jgi:hypothetical protein